VIEPNLMRNPADLEDEYLISIIGNDRRIRTQFEFSFERSRGSDTHEEHDGPEYQDDSDTSHDDTSEQEDIRGTIVYSTTTALPVLRTEKQRDC
jgi:hypothetical protein